MLLSLLMDLMIDKNIEIRYTKHQTCVDLREVLQNHVTVKMNVHTLKFLL